MHCTINQIFAFKCSSWCIGKLWKWEWKKLANKHVITFRFWPWYKNYNSDLSVRWNIFIFTARKRSLRRLCFYKCLSVHRGVVSQHALQVCRPTPRGEVEGSGQGGSPGPDPGGKLRGLESEVSRPSPRWGMEVSRPTPGGDPGPHPEGVCIPACTEAYHPRLLPPADGYCCGWYKS